MKKLCEKVISKGAARNIDPCMMDEIDIVRQFPRFEIKFKIRMSCCGHGKYPRSLVVQNKGSGFVFEWYSGTSLTRSKRRDSRAPYYKRDKEGYYYLPEVTPEKPVGFRM